MGPIAIPISECAEETAVPHLADEVPWLGPLPGSARLGRRGQIVRSIPALRVKRHVYRGSVNDSEDELCTLPSTGPCTGGTCTQYIDKKSRVAEKRFAQRLGRCRRHHPFFSPRSH